MLTRLFLVSSGVGFEAADVAALICNPPIAKFGTFVLYFFVPLGTYGIPCSCVQNAGLSGLLRMLASQAATSPTPGKLIAQ